MPVKYGSIRVEHTAVREDVGIFDVSHMGEITVLGPDAEELCQRLTTNDVSALTPGRSQYSTITNEEGIILDDTLVYQLDEQKFLFIPNAGHDDEMFTRWIRHRDQWELDAEVENETTTYAMIAVQGPNSPTTIDAITGDPVVRLPRFCVTMTTIDGVTCLVSRTGYTGEDGFEILLPSDDAYRVWEAFDCQPCGLGARDTLRLEMGFLLSGQDFNTEKNPRTPFEAGIGFTVNLDAEPAFVGRDALVRQQEAGSYDRFVGFTLVDRAIPRQGYDITNASDESIVIGTVTSGTMSPTLGNPIGLGYVPVEYAEVGTEIGIVVRGDTKRARVETPPFLKDKR